MMDQNPAGQDRPSLPGFALVLTEQVRAVTEKVVEVKDSQDEIQRTLRGYNGTRGLVSRVDSMELLLSQIAADVRAIRQEDHPESDQGHVSSDDDFVSWRYIVDKLGVPIALTAFGFFLTVLCPATIVLVALMPGILKLLGIQ